MGGKVFQFSVFGSFGLSTREPYTIMLCLSSLALSSALVSSSVHTWHRVRQKLHIWYTYASMVKLSGIALNKDL